MVGESFATSSLAGVSFELSFSLSSSRSSLSGLGNCEGIWKSNSGPRVEMLACDPKHVLIRSGYPHNPKTFGGLTSVKAHIR